LFRQLYIKFYPFISIIAIEIGKVIENFNTIISVIILILQIVIGVLTILKIYVEIKHHVFKSIKETEKNVNSRYPFLTALYKFLKRK